MKLHKGLLLFGASALLLTACGQENDATLEEPKDDDVEVVEEVEADEKEKKVNIGERSNPVPLGSTVSQDFSFYDNEGDGAEYEGNRSITLSNVIRGDEAYNLLLQENEFNEPAPEGMEWIVVDVTYVLNEANTEDIPVHVSPDFYPIASDGSEVSQNDYAYIENEFGYVELYSGGSNTGKYVFYAPKDDDVLLKFDDWLAHSIFFSLK